MPSVRMKTASAGPNGNRSIGQICQVSADEGRELVAGGYAEWVERAAEKRAESVPVEEAAVAPAPPENAAKRTTRRGRRE